ncbi:MAG: hypothetical protein OXN88_15535 [Chloroflexota bacterium]|nr:hypothetical protein [Chloroflexota bacterium]
MPNPVIIFAFVIATMYGLGFHVVLGGNARRLVLFVVTSWVGFLLGQYIGGFIEINLLRIGVIHLLPASITAVGLLIFAHVLTAEPTTPVSRR